MATPDESRKRTWRFRLNDATALEVSSPPSATEKQVRRRGRFGLILGTLVAAVTVSTVAYASDVDVSVVDVTVPTNSVTLAPGGSGSITINASVTGNQTGTATFEVYRDWTLSGGTFTGSNPIEWTVPPRSGGDPATTFSTTGTVNVAAGQADGAFTLAVGAFDITNSNTTGAKLAAGDASNYSVTVDTPAPSDTTPPVITPNVSGTLGNNGWYTSDVTVSWTVVDNESAISSSSGCGTTTINANTAGTTLTCTATSLGGTSSESVTIKRDATPPSVSGAPTTSPNAAGWYKSNVAIHWTCSDAPSGLAAGCPADSTISTEGTGLTASSGNVYDNAGNVTNATSSPAVKIDKTPPSVSCNAASFLLNEPGAQVSATIADQAGLSGPLNATEYGAADTSSAGLKSVSITGYDVAGNSATTSCSYTVGYNFDGLYDPVNRPTAMNVSKAGQAIPLKWRLTDYFGNPVLNLASVAISVTNVNCSLGETLDQVEEYATGSSGLQNLGNGYYQFNWKTPTSYASSCKSLHLDLGEGAKRANLAYFSFKK